MVVRDFLEVFVPILVMSAVTKIRGRIWISNSVRTIPIPYHVDYCVILNGTIQWEYWLIKVGNTGMTGFHRENLRQCKIADFRVVRLDFVDVSNN